MSRLRLIPALAALVTLTALGGSAHASFPAGVWGLVEKVDIQPDAMNDGLTMVRIDGLFIVANQKPDFAAYPGYGEPQAGYMYYKCEGKAVTVCETEWKELAAVVGSENNCRGWGDNSVPNNGSVRTGPQPPQNPDTYPLAMGVLMGFSPCEALKAWEVEFPGTTSGGETEGSSTSGDATTNHSTTQEPGTTANSDTEETFGPGGTGTDGGGPTGDATSVATATLGDPTVTTGGEGLTDGPTGSTGAGSTAASTGDTSASGAESGTPADNDKGCACNSAGDPARQLPAALMTLLGLGLLRRRRA